MANDFEELLVATSSSLGSSCSSHTNPGHDMCHERTQSMCTEKVGQHLYTVLVYEGTLSPNQSMTSFTQ